MLLSNLILQNEGDRLYGSDVAVSGVVTDSKQVKSGFLFVAIPGTRFDGIHYVKEALQNGASAILIQNNQVDHADLPEPIRKLVAMAQSGGAINVGQDGHEGQHGADSAMPPVAVVVSRNVRLSLSFVAARFCMRQPSVIAAVTGTSGKTSTAQFARQIWAANGHAAASLGTLGLVTPKGTEYGTLTTPDAVTLHQTLSRIVDENVTHLAMEASSHGLQLHRLDAVDLKVAGFTNLSRDHLDFHPDMEQYLQAKLRLFAELLPQGLTAVLNADIPEMPRIEAVCRSRKQPIISYGRNGLDIRLENCEPFAGGQKLRLVVFGRKYEVVLPLMGDFQVANSLCALGLAIGSGDDPAKSVESLTKLTTVPGRLELAAMLRNGAAVFVDYAHKPGALTHVISALRPHVMAHEGSKLHVLFGCGGDRDSGKRPMMGEIACRLADVVIVSDDNPRSEDPALIRKAIMEGCSAAFAPVGAGDGGLKPAAANVTEIADREVAIKKAIQGLQAGDVLIIAGKGHETGQIIGAEILPFDDRQVASHFVKEAGL